MTLPCLNITVTIRRIHFGLHECCGDKAILIWGDASPVQWRALCPFLHWHVPTSSLFSWDPVLPLIIRLFTQSRRADTCERLRSLRGLRSMWRNSVGASLWTPLKTEGLSACSNSQKQELRGSIISAAPRENIRRCENRLASLGSVWKILLWPSCLSWTKKCSHGFPPLPRSEA